MADGGFYRAFEDKYRGSRQEISKRLKIYLPFIEPLKQIYDECTVVDMGCGRGEWLELVKQAGFSEVGLDIDDFMLKSCSEIGLNAIHANVMEYLGTIADESLVVLSGMHFIEHVPFEDAKKITEEALRVLKPGGLLILETPNSENIAVGTNSFYLDPTHQQPLPPLLLEFLTQYYQFYRVKILRMQETPGLDIKQNIELIDTLANVSRDYAVVAQKNAPPEVISLFDSPFKQDYGLTLEELAHRYDEQQDSKYDQLRKRLNLVEPLSEKLEFLLVELTSKFENGEAKLNEFLIGLDSKLSKMSDEFSDGGEIAEISQRIGILDLKFSNCLKAIQDGNGSIYETMSAVIESMDRFETTVIALSQKTKGIELTTAEIATANKIYNENILKISDLVIDNQKKSNDEFLEMDSRIGKVELAIKELAIVNETYNENILQISDLVIDNQKKSNDEFLEMDSRIGKVELAIKELATVNETYNENILQISPLICEIRKLNKNEFLEMDSRIKKIESAISELATQNAIYNKNVLEMTTFIFENQKQNINEYSEKNSTKVALNLLNPNKYINWASPILSIPMRVALNISPLRQLSNKLLSKFPNIADKLFRFALKENLIRVSSTSNKSEVGVSTAAQFEVDEEHLKKMSLSAQEVYIAAKIEIERLQSKGRS